MIWNRSCVNWSHLTILVLIATLPTSVRAQCPGSYPCVLITKIFASPDTEHPKQIQITLNWAWFEGAISSDFFQILWSPSDKSPQTQITLQNPSNSEVTSHTFSNLDPKTYYGFAVQSCNKSFAEASNCTQWSPVAYWQPLPGWCRVGFVWRNAFHDDNVCVTQAQEATAQAENVAGPGLQKTDGKCISGYVWRQARPSDHVCVSPAERTQTEEENKNASGHTLPRTPG
jgi:hypothetical protein